MARPCRSPLQVSPEFKRKLDELQKAIMKAQGEKKSFRELTEQIIRSPLFEDIEKNMIKSTKLKDDIRISFDRRIF